MRIQEALTAPDGATGCAFRGGRRHETLVTRNALHQVLVPLAVLPVLDENRCLRMVHGEDQTRGGARLRQIAAQVGHRAQRQAGPTKSARYQQAQIAIGSHCIKRLAGQAALLVNRISKAFCHGGRCG